ncbi:MAG: hypothetical protein AAGE84_04520 [Cyanobacteria bacterium P01_G01_bin.39]
MNAFEQVKSLAMISKVEAIVHLFRIEFPECLADLKPWVQTKETEKFEDPSSIDIAFHFPDANLSCRCQSVLMQLKIHQDLNQQYYQAIGIRLSGYAAYQEQWQFSTVGYWEFSGMFKPEIVAQEQFKRICCQTLQLFNAYQKR